jgi:hypothetical protein
MRKQSLSTVTKKYRVVFFGVALNPQTFKQNMARLGVTASTLDKYMEKAPVVLRRDLTLADARRYAETIMNAGGLVHIQETGQFPDTKSPTQKTDTSIPEDFVMCPNCGFKQKRVNYCVRCGFDLSSSA